MKILIATYQTASDRIALAVVRALAGAGHEPWIATDDPTAASCKSRYLKGVLAVPSPITNIDAYAKSLEAYVEQFGFDTVLPADDYAVFALCKAQENGSFPVPVPVPSLTSKQISQDKGHATALAQELGIKTPPTRIVQTEEELETALEEIRPPWVIKLARGGGSVGLEVTDDKNVARAYFMERAQHADLVYDFNKLVIQSFIRGETQDALVLMSRGSVKQQLATRRCLTWPISGGSAVISEIVSRVDFFDDAIKILQALDWHGPANVEFIVDKRDGTAYFIEINGRLWGSTALSTRAGYNFPADACEMAVGKGVVKKASQPNNLRMKFPFPQGPACVVASEDKLRTIWRLFGLAKGTVSDIDWHDIRPTLQHIRKSLNFSSTLNRQKNLSPLALLEAKPPSVQ